MSAFATLILLICSSCYGSIDEKRILLVLQVFAHLSLDLGTTIRAEYFYLFLVSNELFTQFLRTKKTDLSTGPLRASGFDLIFAL